MENNSKTHNMNILNFLNFLLVDKWSFNGILGSVFAFFSPFLVTFTQLHEIFGVMSAFIGVCVAALSLYKLSMQVARETWEFDQQLKGKKRVKSDDEEEEV